MASKLLARQQIQRRPAGAAISWRQYPFLQRADSGDLTVKTLFLAFFRCHFGLQANRYMRGQLLKV
jgi:hypothetical protein